MSLSLIQKVIDCFWIDWVELFDVEGVEFLVYCDIVKIVGVQDGVSLWWVQQVIVGYECIKGLCDVGQWCGGGYDVNKSKMLLVILSVFYQVFVCKLKCECWFEGFEWQLCKLMVNCFLWFDVKDGQCVQLYFIEKLVGCDGRL